PVRRDRAAWRRHRGTGAVQSRFPVWIAPNVDAVGGRADSCRRGDAWSNGSIRRGASRRTNGIDDVDGSDADAGNVGHVDARHHNGEFMRHLIQLFTLIPASMLAAAVACGGAHDATGPSDPGLVSSSCPGINLGPKPATL